MSSRRPSLAWRRLHRLGLFVAIVIFAVGLIGIVQAQEANHGEPSGVARSEAVEGKPLPLGWKIAIVCIVTVGTGFLLAFSIRAWRSSNLFDRQYRFPAVAAVAFRLGANKSGGCMALIEFQ